jgi:tetratricopeptide (TPR) repeat protein
LILQPGTKGGIKGIVTDGAKNPLEGVPLTITSLEHPSEKHLLKTNKKGEFIQIGLEPGPFEVRCEAPGFSPGVQRVRVSISEIAEVSLVLDREFRETVAEVPGKNELAAANELYLAGKYEEALKAYLEAAEKMPGEAAVAYNIGVTFMALNKTDEAIAAFLDLIRTKPDHGQALKNLGQLFGKKKNFEESAKYYGQALQKSPDDAEGWYNLGVSQINLGRTDEARESFLKSIACQDAYAESHFQLGLIYLNQNDKVKAREAMEKFLRLAPEDAKVPLAKKILEEIK